MWLILQTGMFPPPGRPKGHTGSDHRPDLSRRNKPMLPGQHHAILHQHDQVNFEVVVDMVWWNFKRSFICENEIRNETLTVWSSKAGTKITLMLCYELCNHGFNSRNWSIAQYLAQNPAQHPARTSSTKSNTKPSPKSSTKFRTKSRTKSSKTDHTKFRTKTRSTSSTKCNTKSSMKSKHNIYHKIQPKCLI